MLRIATEFAMQRQIRLIERAVIWFRSSFLSVQVLTLY
jgi:hypothetical protein